MSNGIKKLSLSKSIHLRTGAGGMVLAAETIEVPVKHVGILSVRRFHGSNKLSLTSQFLEGGFKGQPELHLQNSGNDLDLIENEQVVNLIIVPAMQWDAD